MESLTCDCSIRAAGQLLSFIVAVQVLFRSRRDIAREILAHQPVGTQGASPQSEPPPAPCQALTLRHGGRDSLVAPCVLVGGRKTLHARSNVASFATDGLGFPGLFPVCSTAQETQPVLFQFSSRCSQCSQSVKIWLPSESRGHAPITGASGGE